MKNNKTLIAASVVILFILVLSGVFWFTKKPVAPNSISSLPMVLDYKKNPVFHPDSVIALTWKMENSEHKYQRENRMKAWSPKVPAKQVQKKLNLLSMMAFEEIGSFGKPIVHVNVEFNNNVVWEGAWDGVFFKWVTGNYAGKGARLKDSLENLEFLAGSKAFEPLQLSWCKNRIDKINIENKINRTLKRVSQGKWMKENTQKDLTELDATEMERWLGRNCSVVSKHLLDEKIFFEFGSPVVKLKFSGQSNQSELNINKNGLIKLIDGDKTILVNSPKLSAELQSLTEY